MLLGRILKGGLGTIVSNSSLLMGSSLLIALTGSVYWWLAARYFPAPTIGLASVAIATMQLLGAVGTLGLGTLLVGELHGRAVEPLLGSALSLAALASGLLGGLVALLTPILTSPGGSPGERALTIGLFAAGVSLTGFTLVLDQALVGLLQTKLQLLRNGIFASTRVVTLLLIGVWAVGKSEHGSALLIYSSWLVGHLIALGCLGALALRAGVRLARARPRIAALRGLGRRSLQHHLLNLILQAPDFLLPLLVAALLSPTSAGYFYIVVKVAALLWLLPYALASVLFALSAAQPEAMDRHLRQTLAISILGGVVGNLVLLVAADGLLGLFGQAYVEQGATSLRLLGLAVFPLTIIEHYIVLMRVRRTLVGATWLMGAASMLQLLAAAAGCRMGGLEGMISAWLGVLFLEMAVLLPTVLRALQGRGPHDHLT
jgi:O-antigen/teichoic acid export membrane protein